jgi:hypothetical protein
VSGAAFIKKQKADQAWDSSKKLKLEKRRMIIIIN